MAIDAAARRLVLRRDRAAERRVAESVRAAGRLGDRLVRALWETRGQAGAASELMAGWARALRDLLIDAGERSHRRAFLDGVQEAAPRIARRRMLADARLARAARDPTTEALEFLRARTAATPDTIAAVRAVYGRLAAEIALPLGASATPRVQAVVRDVVASNVSRRNAQILIAQALAGVTSVQPHHVETIFRSQHQLAYSAGAAAADADPDIAEILWGYRYVTVGDDRVRPAHRALDGVQLPKNDPRWGWLRPPNGYNCRCQLLRVWDTDPHDLVEPTAIDFGDGKGPVQPGADDGWGFNVGDVHRDLVRIERAGAAGAAAVRHRAAVERALGTPEAQVRGAVAETLRVLEAAAAGVQGPAPGGPTPWLAPAGVPGAAPPALPGPRGVPPAPVAADAVDWPRVAPVLADAAKASPVASGVGVEVAPGAVEAVAAAMGDAALRGVLASGALSAARFLVTNVPELASRPAWVDAFVLAAMAHYASRARAAAGVAGAVAAVELRTVVLVGGPLDGVRWRLVDPSGLGVEPEVVVVPRRGELSVRYRRDREGSFRFDGLELDGGAV